MSGIEQLQAIVFFAFLSLIAVTIAYSKGFFRLKEVRPPLSIYLRQVIFVFIIYLGTMTIIARFLIAPFFKTFSVLGNSDLTALTQFISVILVLLLLFIYSCIENKQTFKAIWKDSSSQFSWIKDVGYGVIAWCVSFPIVATIGEICDFIMYGILKMEEHEQVAVRYLKSTLESPLSLVLALITIIFLAPAIEEYLFRGCLQNWLKKRLGYKAAILLSSFFFAIFHLAPSQGAGNISLFFSLLILASFLGYIYERQKSLFAPIGLHMTFNMISAFRLIFAADI